MSGRNQDEGDLPQAGGIAWQTTAHTWPSGLLVYLDKRIVDFGLGLRAKEIDSTGKEHTTVISSSRRVSWRR